MIEVVALILVLFVYIRPGYLYLVFTNKYSISRHFQSENTWHFNTVNSVLDTDSFIVKSKMSITKFTLQKFSPSLAHIGLHRLLRAYVGRSDSFGRPVGTG